MQARGQGPSHSKAEGVSGEPPTCRGSPRPRLSAGASSTHKGLGPAEMQRRICTGAGAACPGGCPRASRELPGCASPVLASLSSTTDANGSRQAGSSRKDQTPGAPGLLSARDGALGAIPGAAAPALALPGDAPTEVRCPCVAAAQSCWQSAGRSLPRGCPRCLHTAATTARAGHGSGPQGRSMGVCLPCISGAGGCISRCQGAGINGSTPPTGLCP